VSLEVVFEDNWVCVISKPVGWVVNKSETTQTQTVQEWFVARENGPTFTRQSGEFWEKGGVVHRLDKDTSGVMVLAKTEAAYEKLKQQFLERKTKKMYVALVLGKVNQAEGVISQPIDRHPVIKSKFSISKNLARMAITEWRVVKEYQVGGVSYSQLELYPLTGRTHQLRVHLQAMGHPILGDEVYGHRKAKGCWPRMYLHAVRLEFEHPDSGVWMRFEVPVPWEFENLLH